MSTVEERRALRLRVMKAIYEAANGSQTAFVNGWSLREELAIADQDMADACFYLAGEYLVELHQTLAGGILTPHQIQLTHRGIVEMESSEMAPERPTEHFPAQINVSQTFAGPVNGLNMQVGSPGAALIGNSFSPEALALLIDQFLGREAELQLTPIQASIAQEAVSEIRDAVASSSLDPGSCTAPSTS